MPCACQGRRMQAPDDVRVRVGVSVMCSVCRPPTHTCVANSKAEPALRSLQLNASFVLSPQATSSGCIYHGAKCSVYHGAGERKGGGAQELVGTESNLPAWQAGRRQKKRRIGTHWAGKTARALLATALVPRYFAGLTVVHRCTQCSIPQRQVSYLEPSLIENTAKRRKDLTGPS